MMLANMVEEWRNMLGFEKLQSKADELGYEFDVDDDDGEFYCKIKNPDNQRDPLSFELPVINIRPTVEPAADDFPAFVRFDPLVTFPVFDQTKEGY